MKERPNRLLNLMQLLSYLVLDSLVSGCLYAYMIVQMPDASPNVDTYIYATKLKVTQTLKLDSKIAR